MFLSLNEVCEILGIISGTCTALDINAYLFISEYDLDSHLQASSYFDKRVYTSPIRLIQSSSQLSLMRKLSLNMLSSLPLRNTTLKTLNAAS